MQSTQLSLGFGIGWNESFLYTQPFSSAFSLNSKYQVDSLLQSDPPGALVSARNLLYIPQIVTLLSIASVLIHFSRKASHPPSTGNRTREGDHGNISVTERGDNGGRIVLAWMVARALGSAAVTGLSVPGALRIPLGIGVWSDNDNDKAIWDSIPWCLLISNLYAFLLAYLAIVSTTWRMLSARHNAAILASELAVYAYRDLWPLATYTQHPLDAEEDWIIWAKIGALAFTAVVVPLCIPSVYISTDYESDYDGQPLHPEQTASILSSWTFSYLTPTIATASKVAHLTPDLMPPVAEYDTSRALAARTSYFLNSSKIRQGHHIGFALLRFLAPRYLVGAMWIVVLAACQVGAPVAINRLLVLLESGRTETTIVRPWFWVLCLLVLPVFRSIGSHSYLKTMSHAMAQVESLLTQLLFNHSLRVRVLAEGGGVGNSSDSSQRKPTSSVIGRLNNLATIDLANITGTRDLIMVVWYLPIQVTLSSMFLYSVLGWSAFVGLALMVALLPIPGYMTTFLQDAQFEKMKKTDERTHLVTETMNVLRTLKLFGWEKKFEEKIAQLRDEELLWVWKGKLLNLIVMLVNNLIPTVTMLATFATATLVLKIELTASRVFSSILVFDNLRDEIQIAYRNVGALVRGKVSLDRFNDFFKQTELLDSYDRPAFEDIAAIRSSLRPESGDLFLRSASFSWNTVSATELPTFSFVLKVPEDLRFKQGRINLIVGPTGSGKTSLLMALLGEMHFIQTEPDSAFNLPRAGGVAFAAQESWVQNETIRENILFHSPYEKERYEKVLYQCALEPDLELFEAGDLTEVGERGLTLSGGQKARLTLARAVYSKAQIILLDDILAALDVHTAKWVVDKCLKGDLVRGRTVLLVTHNIALARPITDFVVSVSSGGVVTSHGTNIAEVLEAEPALQAEEEKGQLALSKAEELIDKRLEKNRKASGTLIVEEEIQQGDVSWKAWRLFFKAIGGTHAVPFFVLLAASYIFEVFILNFNLWFLGYWSSQYESHPASDVPVVWYLLIYVGLMSIWVVNNLSKDVWYTLGTLRASKTIHKILTKSIIGATLRWLDETPAARVITRMTQDIGSLDGTLVYFVDAFVSLFMAAVGNLMGAIVFVPVFAIPGLGVISIGAFAGRRYMKAQLSVKRELSKAKAPMLSHFGAAMAGLVSIRAYGAEEIFKQISRNKTDHYIRIARLNSDLNRWIGVRIDSLGAVFTGALAAYLTYYSTIKTANIGFSLSKGVEFTTWTLHLVLVSNVLQIEATSMERITAYTEIEQEPKPEESECGKPPASWPATGGIRVENLTARYSKHGPAVLHGLSFQIHSGERVGVVGRTGSGKSSLTLALLRAINTEGTVYFDGLRTDSLDLDTLRSNITLIPQSPELLSGTLRFNLDPFDEYDDADLNQALKASGLLSTRLGEHPFSLDTMVALGGANLSAGQRQIVSLARAIIRSSKFLILDEATSAIDSETDGVIQNTLRRELGSDVTVLTIAHRLETIMDSDRIMVLDAGRIVEFASPSELLSRENGVFKALIDGSGDSRHLYDLVRAR